MPTAYGLKVSTEDSYDTSTTLVLEGDLAGTTPTDDIIVVRQDPVNPNKLLVTDNGLILYDYNPGGFYGLYDKIEIHSGYGNDEIPSGCSRRL